MKCLELFSGTHSVGKCCKEIGIDVLSLDIDGRADINISILEWDYKVYKKDEFDIIWASPPCDRYSCLNYSNIGRKLKRLNGDELTMDLIKEGWEEADKLVIKTIEIINYFNPELWFIENPSTSTLKNRPFMKDIFFYDVDYCMYSDYGYKKPTRIWTNKKDWNALKCNGKCNNMNGKKHKNNMCSVNMSGENRLDLRHRVPPNLIYSLLMN